MTRLIIMRPKRRREGKTNYRARFTMLKSNKPRLVVRKTNRYLIAQIIESKEAQDFVKVHVNSKELKKVGWEFSFKNIPAAYLTGLIIGKKALEKGIKEAILDIGIIDSTKGSRIYAVLKGAIDSGLNVKHSEEILPSIDRIQGRHIQKNSGDIIRKFEEIKNNIIKSKKVKES